MSAAHLPPADPLPVRDASAASHLRMEEVLASSRRIWLRGWWVRASAGSGSGRHRRWWGRPAEAPPARMARLETVISGCRLQAELPLDPDGAFEALLSAELPAARRGWRVARNKLTCEGETSEACAIVLLPPPRAREAVVVTLPLESTLVEGRAGLLAGAEGAADLAAFLRQLAGGAGLRPLYYLACVPALAGGRVRELAVAMASLGWPAGQVVPLFAPVPAPAVLAHGLDRLRWLFAGELELLACNLEPAADRLLQPAYTPAAGRARVCPVKPGDEAGPGAGGNGPAPACPVGWLRPSRAGRVTRYPLVFCHGMLAFSTLRMQLPEDLNSFSGLRPILHQRGFRALFPQVSPTGGTVDRAAQLADQVRRWTDEPVNIIAHSMGGLDARQLIALGDMAGRVRSLTTISTPHRGTWLADWFLANYRNRVPLLRAMEAFGVNVDGFADCRPAACAALNARTPDVPGVSYFSYGGAVEHCRVSPILRRPWCLLTPIEGPNDGMVSVASARWGEYLGTVAADHFAQTPDAAFLRAGEDFDAFGFYLKIVEDLAYRGF